MTGRERLQAILIGEPVDRLAWTTLVDDITRSGMPAEYRAGSVLDFYRKIGCDILQFGNYALPPNACVVPPCRVTLPDARVAERTTDDGTVIRDTETPWGTLTATFRSGHPVRHPVQSAADLDILLRLWRGATCEPLDGMEESFVRAEEAIGDDGLYVYTMDPSPVQQLVQFDMGVGAFYYFLADQPAEMEELLGLMHTRRLEEYEAVAQRVPALAIVPVENTSSNLTSPSVYRRHSLPHLRDYVDVIHRHGKKAILHMCGRLKALLPDIAATGLDGINGLTPPPVGDVTFEEALDVLGDDLVVFGGLLDPDAFQADSASRQTIWRALDQLYTPRIRRSNLLLWLGADGLATPLDRFLAVREWMAERGSQQP